MIHADRHEQERPEPEAAGDEMQPLAEQDAAEHNPDRSANHGADRARLYQLRDTNHQEDCRPVAQHLARAQDLQVVEREEHTERREQQPREQL